MPRYAATYDRVDCCSALQFNRYVGVVLADRSGLGSFSHIHKRLSGRAYDTPGEAKAAAQKVADRLNAST